MPRRSKKKQMVHNDTINNEETLCNDFDHYFVNIFNLDHNEFNNGLPIDMKMNQNHGI